MVAEVQFIGTPGECLHCLFCMPALAQILSSLPPRAAWTTARDIHSLASGLGPLCVTVLCPADRFHYAAVGALVELSWKHAHGPGRAVLGASWVRDILRNLKHRAFLTNAPRSRAPGGLRVL